MAEVGSVVVAMKSVSFAATVKALAAPALGL